MIPSKNIKIKFNRPLHISGSGDQKLVFDMIPGKSIHLIETGSGKFILRPVIKVKLIGEDSSRDMAKIKGRIESVNCSEEHLVLMLETGNTLEVEIEDAVIIPLHARHYSKDEHDDDDDEHEEKAFKAACAQLEPGMMVEIIGTLDDDEFEASSIQILDNDAQGNRIEFSSTLLELDCENSTLKVPFSRGEILVQYSDLTEFEQDGKTIAPGDRCKAMEAVVNKTIDIEGQVIENQIVATRIILPSTVALNIMVRGAVDLLTLDDHDNVTGFVLKKEDGSLFTVNIDRRFESHTEIRGQNGEVISADSIPLDSEAKVTGTLDPATSPYPSIAATKIELFSATP